MQVKFCVLEQTVGLHCHAKFYLNVFIVSANRGQKPQFWANFEFWGLLYRPPFTDDGQMWCAIADPWYTLTCQISSRSVYSFALCWRKNPIFAVSWTSAFSGVANWHQSQNVEHECTTTNLPLSNGIKIVSVIQRFLSEIWRTISDVQKRDEQTDKHTDKQTRKLNVFGHPGGG